MKPGLTAQLLRGARWPAIAAVGIAYPIAAHPAAAADHNPGLLDAAVAIAPQMAVGLVVAWRPSQRHWMLLCAAASVCSRYAARLCLLAPADRAGPLQAFLAHHHATSSGPLPPPAWPRRVARLSTDP